MSTEIGFQMAGEHHWEELEPSELKIIIIHKSIGNSIQCSYISLLDDTPKLNVSHIFMQW